MGSNLPPMLKHASILLLLTLIGCAEDGPAPDPATPDATPDTSGGEVQVGQAHGTPNGLPDCGGPPADWAGSSTPPVVELVACTSQGDSHGEPALCFWALPFAGGPRQQVTNCYPTALFTEVPRLLPYAAGYTCPATCPTDAGSGS